MKQSESIGKLAAALVQAQLKLQPVAMDASNRFNKKYASLDAIMEAVRPVLAEVRLVVVQGATLPTTDEGGRLTTITLETTLVHESGEWLSSMVMFPVVATNPVKDAQGVKIGVEPMGADVAAAISFARRIGIGALLCLSNDDSEAQPAASSNRSQPKRVEKPAAPAVAPKTAPAPAAPAPATVPQKAADRRIATPNGDRRLGDYSNEELVKLQERARTAGKKDLENAIDEVFLDRENEALDRAGNHA